MNSSLPLTCPACKSKQLYIKYEAAYVYSYQIDTDAPGTQNTEEFLPFLFDNREQKETHQYIECGHCGARYPCYFNQWEGGASLEALQKAIAPGNAGSSSS